MKKILIERGVAEGRIELHAPGSDQVPVILAGNVNSEENRRVEVVVVENSI